jgi:hypothetical protein
MNAFTRRGLLAASAAAATAVQASSVLAKVPLPSGAPEPDATTMADRIRRKDISPLEAFTEAIRRAEAAQPQLNFIVTSLFDQAL